VIDTLLVRPYVAWRPGFPAILRFKGQGVGPWRSIDVWHTRQWNDFGGATPTISDVSRAALGVARRWRARNPATWDDLHRAPPLWLLVGTDGRVDLTDHEAAIGLQAVRIRELDQEDAYALVRFPHL